MYLTLRNRALIRRIRQRMAAQGHPIDDATDEQIVKVALEMDPITALPEEEREEASRQALDRLRFQQP